mmetsp:Transcript_6461/g.16513  ORF Transcript_6461/g.16513 Transcript_6461/m.16513 type:complete len:288 (-) Transcript_6461:559-1422(-)
MSITSAPPSFPPPIISEPELELLTLLSVLSGGALRVIQNVVRFENSRDDTDDDDEPPETSTAETSAVSTAMESTHVSRGHAHCSRDRAPNKDVIMPPPATSTQGSHFSDPGISAKDDRGHSAHEVEPGCGAYEPGWQGTQVSWSTASGALNHPAGHGKQRCVSHHHGRCLYPGRHAEATVTTPSRSLSRPPASRARQDIRTVPLLMSARRRYSMAPGTTATVTAPPTPPLPSRDALAGCKEPLKLLDVEELAFDDVLLLAKAPEVFAVAAVAAAGNVLSVVMFSVWA